MFKDKNICFFCASSNSIAQIYIDHTIKIATLIAKNNADLIFGGGSNGLMGAVAKVFKEHKRKIVSVIPEKLNKKGIVYENSTKILETDSMHKRKELMIQMSDAFIALPGGFGTLDEILELITLKQLGYHNKPLIIYNPLGFYNPLIEQFNILMKENFINRENQDIYFISNNCSKIIEFLKNTFNNPDI